MLIQGSAWMRRTLATILLCFATGCASVAPSPAAICDGTAQARTDHAAALADSADDRAVVTGARLIRLLDAGCGSA